VEEKKIDFSRYRRTAENNEVERAQNPQQQLRPQSEIERHPTFFQRKQEQEARSNWSGGVWGGRQDRSR
jgi:uncharacterized cupin superfamily protein